MNNKAEALQSASASHASKSTTRWLESSYVPHECGTTPVLFADDTKLLIEKYRIIELWVKHFNLIPDQLLCVINELIEDTSQLIILLELDKEPIMMSGTNDQQNDF